MTQKVLKVGTSAAVTIPKKAMDLLGLKVGDQVNVDIDQERQTFRIAPVARADKEFSEWMGRFVEEYRPALEALSKK